METVKQEEKAIETTEKTFTQEEVDTIIGERLKRERAKYPDMADYNALKEKAGKYDEMVESSKSELQKAIERGDALQTQLDEMRNAELLRSMRESVASEAGVPASLLTGTSEEECIAQAKTILEFARPGGYPKVRDGGEVANTGKKTTRQQFAEWASEFLG